jgi:hypothetical protein
MCGIFATLLYVAVNIIVPMQDPGYDWRSQAVSELSAVDAPTRQLWIWLCLPYSLLMIAFGYGVRLSAAGSKALRWAGSVVIGSALVGILWPPMHQREVLAVSGGALTDTLHIVFTMIWGVASLATMGLAAAALRCSAFRIFTVVSALATIGFGVLTGMDSPNMEKNLPTPMMGVWERIGMAAFMVWVIVFAIALFRQRNEALAPVLP